MRKFAVNNPDRLVYHGIIIPEVFFKTTRIPENAITTLSEKNVKASTTPCIQLAVTSVAEIKETFYWDVQN